jgi:hypothetical protein
LLAGLSLFSSLPTSVKHTAIIYPTDAVCGGPTSSFPDLALADVIDAYAQHVPAGGTPTSAALQFATRQLEPPLTETFVVLVTDGQPNCNSNNPNGICNDQSPSQVAACRCTTSNCDQSLCSIGCIDELTTQTAAQALADTGAELMVVGVGGELASSSSSLSSMKLGLPRTCASAIDCPGSTCGADGLCSNPLYFSTHASDYRAPADRLDVAVRRSAACTLWLDRGVLPQNLTVAREGASLAAADWSLTGTRQLKLLGATCDAVLAGGATPQVSWLPLLQ